MARFNIGLRLFIIKTGSLSVLVYFLVVIAIPELSFICRHLAVFVLLVGFFPYFLLLFRYSALRFHFLKYHCFSLFLERKKLIYFLLRNYFLIVLQILSDDLIHDYVLERGN